MRFTLDSLPQMVLASLAKSADVLRHNILGCERCASVCIQSADALCKCCRQYKTRTAGGTPVFFPDDGKGHYIIGTREELLEKHGRQAQ